ncbi:MAG: polyprenyl synthetase family protein [Halieaceae bacterium]|nr:polyprenyl synthetase family protein [Halieaceae bacterium]
MIAEHLSACKTRVEACLSTQLKHLPAEAALAQGMAYSLNVGGKRLRPALVYSAALSLRLDLNVFPPSLTPLDLAAAAVEAVHTYSLVHDDLPAMDDDDLRRGKPTVHKQYNEATAILVGDALQAWAFELLTQIDTLPSDKILAMVKELAQASGPKGMVLGQALDMQATGVAETTDYLKQLHSLKTGALIRASIRLGASCMNTGPKERRALNTYGEAIGLCFQVVDDILDVTTDSVTLGKTAGKDEEADKLTYVKLLGLEGAKAEAQSLCEQAKAAVIDLPNPQVLIELADYICKRAN